MYEVKLLYPKHKQFEPSLTYKESITHCATVELFLRGIHTSQASATRIVFENEQDRTLGLLILSGDQRYTAVCIWGVELTSVSTSCSGLLRKRFALFVLNRKRLVATAGTSCLLGLACANKTHLFVNRCLRPKAVRRNRRCCMVFVFCFHYVCVVQWH